MGTARATTVYDVEAEGGVTASSPPGRPGVKNEPVDLMTAMRERTTVRGRRSGGRRKATPTDLPGGGPPDDALPLEDFSYDPVTEEPPPPAHVHPDDDPQVAAAEAAKPEVESVDTPSPSEAVPVGAAPTDEVTAGGTPADSEKSAAARRGSRASVPSWDDIMFGARRD